MAEYLTPEQEGKLLTKAIKEANLEDWLDINNNLKKNTIVKKSENIIFYGVPGCGKSYKVNEEFPKGSYDRERVVFHQDYSYSDFVGQILPKKDGDDVVYDFVPGPFTRILEKAYKSLYDGDNKNFVLIIEELNRGNAPAILGDIFQLIDIKRDEEGHSQYSITNKDIADEIRNYILDDNKVNLAEELENIFNNYPIDKDAMDPNNAIERKKEIAKVVSHDVEAGVIELNDVKQAKKLFELLNDGEIKLPCNLSIVATMNTSDQNVFPLDTAFQRRWDRLELIENIFNGSDDLEKKEILDTGLTWGSFIEIINDKILEESSEISSEDKRLGTHFIHENDLKDEKKFAGKILKYLWDDAFKLNREQIFNEKYKCLENLLYSSEGFIKSSGIGRFKIFNDELFDKIKESCSKVENSATDVPEPEIEDVSDEKV